MVDALLADGAVEIVDPEPQGQLRELHPEHGPVALDVRDVVEHQPADGQGLEAVGVGGLGDLAQPVALVVELQRDEGLEATGLVLQLAQPDQVIDALLGALDRAEQHGAVRAHAHLVRRAVHRQPALGVDLVVAQLLAGAGREDLRAAAGHAVEARVAQRPDDLCVGQAVLLGVVVDLHRGEALDVQIGPLGLQRLQQVGVVAEGQIGVQPVDDVHLGHELVAQRAHPPHRLLDRHRVGLWIAGLEPREAAEDAAGLAHVGGVDVEVAVEPRQIAVACLAHQVGQRADRRQLGAPDQRDAVVERQALAGEHLLGDVAQARAADGLLGDLGQAHHDSPRVAAPSSSPVQRRVTSLGIPI